MEEELALEAMREWRALLGERSVIEGRDAQTQYGLSTTGSERSILGALTPQNKEEVVDIVKIASHYNIPLYPISCGNNWGYGSANPAIDGCVIVDLSSMRKILEFNAELGLITVEPGVTMGQLNKYIREHALPFVAPTITVSPNGSLIGNMLDKGFSGVAFVDRVATLMSLEAVLADGSTYRSSSAEKNLGGFFKWGAGPYLDGLFIQSNIGIVTGATMALSPLPAYSTECVFSPKTEVTLSHTIDILRTLQQKLGNSISAVKIENPQRVFSESIPYPQNIPLDTQTLPESFIEETLRSLSLTEWTVFLTVQGEKDIVSAAKKIIQKDLGSFAEHLFFYDEKVLNALPRAHYLIPKKMKGLVSTILQKQRRTGRLPNTQTLSGVPFWRRDTSPSTALTDLDADPRCGIIFFMAVLPMIGASVEGFAHDTKRICKIYEIEPILKFSKYSDTCLLVSLPLLFDKASAEQTGRARICYEKLFEMILLHGGYVHRVPIDHMDLLFKSNKEHWQFVHDIKMALDPHDIFSPGRYNTTIRESKKPILQKKEG